MPIEEQIDVEQELKKEKLIKRLNSFAKHAEEDKEKVHIAADKLLLDYLGDYEIRMAFDNIKKWYA